MFAAVLTGAGAAWFAFLLLTRPRGFRPAARMEAPLAAGPVAPRRRFERRRADTWAGSIAGGIVVWRVTSNPAAALVLGAAAATLPGFLDELGTTRARDRRERELCEFAAACADALATEPSVAQALAEAARGAPQWLGSEVDAALGRHAAGQTLAEALRARAGVVARRDLALLFRLLAALAERGAAGAEAVERLAAVLRHRRELRAERRAELAGHSAFAGILFLLPPAAYLSLVSLWPTAAQVLRHTLLGQVAVAFSACSEAVAWLALRRAARWVD